MSDESVPSSGLSELRFFLLLEKLRYWHTYLWGDYSTPATLSWNVNEPEAEVLETR